MITDDEVADQAVAWLGQHNNAQMDWPAFTAWLEADPRHRRIYNELALIDADLGIHRDVLVVDDPSAVANAVSPRRAWRTVPWIGGAIAASLIAIIVVRPIEQTPSSQDYRATRSNTSVALKDGTKIVLAPGSHLAVRDNVMVLDGSAFFDVPHLASRSLSIDAGAFRVTDIGTRFSITSEPGDVSVDVAEGSLAVRSVALERAITLTAGHGMAADGKTGAVRLIDIASGDVASWRSGKLQFNQMRLALVVRRITRYSGTQLSVDPAIADRTFSGVIAIDSGSSPARALAQILSLDVDQVDGSLRLRPRKQS